LQFPCGYCCSAGTVHESNQPSSASHISITHQRRTSASQIIITNQHHASASHISITHQHQTSASAISITHQHHTSVSHISIHRLPTSPTSSRFDKLVRASSTTSITSTVCYISGLCCSNQLVKAWLLGIFLLVSS